MRTVLRLILVSCVCAGDRPAKAAAQLPRTILRAGQSFGICDELNLSMFSDPRFDALHPASVRLIIPWSTALDAVLNKKDQDRGKLPVVETWRAFTDQWYAAALAHKPPLQPLITFNGYGGDLPEVSEYRKAARAAVMRWPQANFEAWNEENLRGEATYAVAATPAAPGKPGKPSGAQRAAGYAKALDGLCRGGRCISVPISLVTGYDAYTRKWVKTFLHYYGRKPPIWAFHNYNDVNGETHAGLAYYMKLYNPRKVWITETGAYYHVGPYPPSLSRQTLSAAHVLDPFRQFPNRVERLYYYQWQAASNTKLWDTALLDNSGTPRPVYDLLLNAFN